MNNSGLTQAELQQMQVLLTNKLHGLNKTKTLFIGFAKDYRVSSVAKLNHYKYAFTLQAKINKLAKLQHKVKKLQKQERKQHVN